MFINFPFDHLIIDNFFEHELAEKLSEQFPDYEEDLWYAHDNVTEVKKLVNNWNRFPPETYKTFVYLNSLEFIEKVKKLTGIKTLYADNGLHGGGWHIHKNGGKLNIHQDYSIHPKLGLQRKLNLIVYMTKDWNYDYGGELELWSDKDGQPFKKEKSITPLFNRAVLFDTTQNSWHGLPEEMNLPKGIFRKSIAVYYLTDPPEGVNQRKRALFTPTEKQKGNKEVEEFIKKRAEWKKGKLFFK